MSSSSRFHPDFLNLLQQALVNDCYFAAFRLPGSAVTEVMIQSQPEIQLSEQVAFRTDSGFLIHPFNSRQNPSLWIKPDMYFRSDDEEIPALLPSPKYSRTFAANGLIPISKEDYIRTVDGLIAEMKAGAFEKLVFTRCEKSGKSNFNLVEIFQEIVVSAPDTMSFLFNLPGGVSWMGSTPETLLSFENNIGKTMALAGTKQSDTSNYWTEKEFHEHAIVSNEISGIMKKMAVTCKTVGPVTKQINSDLQHLCTTFELQANGALDRWDLATALHPTAAVCGIPREKVKNRIQETEGYNRSYYTGFLGPVNHAGKTSFHVNLRSAVFHQNTMYWFAGGGITADSAAGEEWKETELKSFTIRRYAGDL